MTTSGTQFDVSGNPFKVRKTLKKLGGKWIGKKEAWRFFNNDPTERIANELNELEGVLGVPEAVPGATGRAGGGVETGGLGGEGVRPGKPPRFEGDIGEFVGEDTQRALKEGGKKASIPKNVIDGQIEDAARIVRAHKEGKPMFLGRLPVMPAVGVYACQTIHWLKFLGFLLTINRKKLSAIENPGSVHLATKSRIVPKTKPTLHWAFAVSMRTPA